jgi:hypothetical protein
MNGRRAILDAATNQECELVANPSARVDGQSYKALLIGIRGTKTQSEEYPELKGPHKDVEKVKALIMDWYVWDRLQIALLLISTSYGYRDPDITILIDDGIAGHVQPTRANIVGLRLRSLCMCSSSCRQLTAIRNLVKGAKAGDHFFFHCMYTTMQSFNACCSVASS